MRAIRRGIIAVLLLSGGAFAEEILAAEIRPSGLSHACNSCHGPAGHSPGAIPPIDGMPREQFIEAMRAFKSGERPGTIMGRIAPAYSDAEIAAMAEYYRASVGEATP